VVGDFDGNGFDDVIWYAPGAGADYLWSSSTSGLSSKPLSVAGDYRPVAGDFNGDGVDDVIWYAPGAAADYVWYGSRSGFSSKPISVNGDDRPVGNVWWEDPPPPPSRSPRPTQNPLRNLAPGQVALTFDDGPSRYTPQVLDILDRAGVPA